MEVRHNLFKVSLTESLQWQWVQLPDDWSASTSKLLKDPTERLLYVPEVCCRLLWWWLVGIPSVEGAVFHPSMFLGVSSDVTLHAGMATQMDCCLFGWCLCLKASCGQVAESAGWDFTQQTQNWFIYIVPFMQTKSKKAQSGSQSKKIQTGRALGIASTFVMQWISLQKTEECECVLSAQTIVLPVSDCCTFLSGQVILCCFLVADIEFLLQLMLGH